MLEAANYKLLARMRTYRLLLDVRESLEVGLADLAVDLIGPTTIVSQSRGAVGNIGLGHGDRLSVVKRLDSGEQIGVLLELERQVHEQLAAVLGSDFPPLALESLAGSGNGKVDILLGGLMHGADNLFGGGVDDLEGLAVNALHELVVNEAVCGVCGQRGIESGRGIGEGLQASRLLVLAGVRRVEGGGSHVGWL